PPQSLGDVLTAHPDLRLLDLDLAEPAPGVLQTRASLLVTAPDRVPLHTGLAGTFPQLGLALPQLGETPADHLDGAPRRGRHQLQPVQPLLADGIGDLGLERLGYPAPAPLQELPALLHGPEVAGGLLPGSPCRLPLSFARRPPHLALLPRPLALCLRAFQGGRAGAQTCAGRLSLGLGFTEGAAPVLEPGDLALEVGPGAVRPPQGLGRPGQAGFDRLERLQGLPFHRSGVLEIAFG